MRIVKITLLLVFFVSYLSFSSLGTNVIVIKAEHVSYNGNLSMYYAYGKCMVYNGDYRLRADYINYDSKTSVAVAKGNVYLTDNSGDWIEGRYAKFNYSTYKGFVNDAVMFIKSSGLYIKAKQIIMYNRNRYFIKKGSVTSCKCMNFLSFDKKCYPKWSISSSDTYVVRNKYLFSYPVVLRARSVPILFLPFIRRNLSKKRKTGFLMPQFGFSSDNGFIYIQPFFIDINPSQDITLYPFVYSRKGNGLRLEYRFYWTRNSKGDWKITLFKDKFPYAASMKKHFRVNIKANQWFNFGKYGTLKYNINLVNNKNNLRVIDQNNIALSGDRYTTSTASYYIAKSGYFFSMYANYYQDLVAQNNKDTLQDLPIIKFGVIGKRVFEGLMLDFTQTMANEFRIEGQRGIYTDSTGFLYYPFAISHFNVTPKVGVHQLWARWKDAPAKKEYYYRSFVPDYRLSLSTELVGIFLNKNTTGFKGVKHTIKPTLEYEYIPERSQRFPDFVSIYPKTNLVTFNLENTLTAKYLVGNSSLYRDILYNKLSVQYDFTKAYGTPFPPVYEETVVKPFKFISFTSKAHYFFKKHIFTDSTESLVINGKKSGFSVGYSMSRDSSYELEDETLNSKVYTYPLDDLYMYVELQRSIMHHYYSQRKFGFMYSDSCWGFGLDFYLDRVSQENFNGTYSTHLNKGFWITLSLNGVFSIKRQY